MAQRRLLVVAAAALALALTVGSGGFSGVAADRGVSVAVADDDDAFLRVVDDPVILDNGNYPTVNDTDPPASAGVGLLLLENQFPDGEMQEVQLQGPPSSQGPPPVVTHADIARPGETVRLGDGTRRTLNDDQRAVVADVSCGGSGESEVSATVRVELDSGTAITLTRTVEIRCTGDRPPTAADAGPVGVDDQSTPESSGSDPAAASSGSS